MKLVLGTVQFGLSYGVTNSTGKPSLEQTFAVLDSAWESGIRILDSAQAYGDANQVVAQYHAQRSHRFKIINKVLRHPEGIGSVYETLERERDALLIDAFECVMFHYPASIGPAVPGDFFFQLATRGISKKSGLSTESAEDYQRLRQRFFFEVVQLPSNPINQKFITDAFIGSLAQDHVDVHVRSTFLQGLLLAGVSVPTYLAPLAAPIGKMAHDSARRGISMITACLLYHLQKKSIGHIVVGAQDVNQLQGILDAYKEAESIRSRVQLPWYDYACDDFDLAHPVQWEKLKASIC